MIMETYTVVAALEFGNSYSGYAFSKKPEFETNPPNIHINSPWNHVDNAFSEKRTSTCILFNSEKKIQCIGYDAESRYANYNEDDRNKSYFFRFFQQNLIDKDFSKDKHCGDMLKHLSFKFIVSSFIKALADKCRQQIRETYGNIQNSEIRWVITVPADLILTAEQFMKECLHKAKFPQGQFTLVTETEAAFAYCQKLLKSDRYSKLEDNAEYMIVDLGVDEADIRVVKNVNGDMTEKYRKSRTRERFSAHHRLLDFLGRTISFNAVAVLIKDPSVYLDIERGLEELKLFALRKKKIIVHLPLTIETELRDCSPNMENKWIIEDHKLVLLEDTIAEILKNEIDVVITQMENVFQSYRDAHTISYIIMTGDFYKCCLVKHLVDIKFPQKHTIFSEFIEEAVMKGAVVSGWQPYVPKYEMLRAYDKPIEKKGFVLVINFVFPGQGDHTREGSHDDVEKLQSFFTEPKYKVVCWRDMKKEDLLLKLDTIRDTVLAQHADLYHSFICVIMSHGNQQGIDTTDKQITVDELIAPFKNNVAQGFIGKPKVFLIQACRGEEAQDVHQYENKNILHDYSAVSRMPTDADIIIIYATTPGYVSIRQSESITWNGSWLIHAFLTVAEKYRNNHILEILTAVNFELANNPEYELDGGKKCQVSMSEMTLSKLFYL